MSVQVGLETTVFHPVSWSFETAANRQYGIFGSPPLL
jgi:hypothetical protein